MEQSHLVGRDRLIPPLWLVVCGLGISQIIGWGTTYYALGALSEDIARDTGWSQSLIFGAFSAALLLSGAISAWAGRRFDVEGGRRLMSIGSILAALGCLLIGGIAHPVAYVAGWLVLGVAMRLVLYDAAFASLAQIAGSGARRAISYVTLFGGLASTVFWPTSHFLSEGVGWSNTFLIYAMLHLLICLPIHALLLSGQAQLTNDVSSPQPEEHEPLKGTARRTAIALFAAVIAFNGVVFAAISAHVLPLFQELGFAGNEAVAFAALIGPSQVASRIGEIMLGRKLAATDLGIIAFGLLPLALAVFALGMFSTPAALAFALLYGASNGLVTIAKGAVPLVLFGRKGYGEVLGILAAPNLVLNAAAPLLFAMLLQHVSAPAALMIAGSFALLSAMAMILLSKMHRR